MQFLKAQASSLLASTTDFVVFVLCRYFTRRYALVPEDMVVVMSTMVGNIIGGVVNFLVNRNFVFYGANRASTQKQGLRYASVWTGNLLLNMGGVYLMAVVLGCNELFSKVFVSLVVGFFYNYLLQKNFVFSTERQEHTI